VVDVLRGSEKQRILELGHDRLSTYGIGADLSVDAWRSLLQQLVHLGYLQQEMGQYPVLKLTSAAMPVLRGEDSLMLARPRVKVARSEGLRSKGRRAKGAAGWARGGAAAASRAPADDDALFEDLRALRRRIAEREGVPAYVIFHDSTLREMAEVRPTRADELLEIGGIGERKLEKYGDDFLALLTWPAPGRRGGALVIYSPERRVDLRGVARHLGGEGPALFGLGVPVLEVSPGA
jgi:ATP-dependent DNA helicase RecQ